jgi:MFS transporter, OFA family, oxalate/formate antiporter
MGWVWFWWVFLLGKGILPMFILSYGIVAGLGLGIGYITPVSILISWFPDRRGLASGMAIMGFGFSAMIFGPVMTKLFALLGVSNTFYILGGVYFVVILLSSTYLEAPPEGWVPKGFVTKNSTETNNFGLTVNQVLKTNKFYIMWFMFFINITCGIAIISVASPLAQDVFIYSYGCCCYGWCYGVI